MHAYEEQVHRYDHIVKGVHYLDPLIVEVTELKATI